MKSLFYTITNIWHPEKFQGRYKKDNYFEGWYYKLVDHGKNEVLAIIPGVFLSKKADQSQAFIQVYQGKKQKFDFFTFPVEQFRADKKSFRIYIGQNEFSDQQIKLALNNEKTTVSGSLYFTELNRWPKSLYAPGAMGPYSYVPMMQCNHAVISMNHRLKGMITINDHDITFDQGLGYMEKDWGRGFPSAYVWLQCNHFSQAGVSLFASIAKVPWITGAFRGFIIGLLIEGEVYRFATYTGARLKYLKIKNRSLDFEVADKQYRLHVHARRDKEVILHAPYSGQFIQRASESLFSELKITLSMKKNNSESVILSASGYPAGIDVNGQLDQIAYLD
jgi:hypothetical protein